MSATTTVQEVMLRRGDQIAPVPLTRRYEDVLDRVGGLMAARDATLPAMSRTAAILDGGERAVLALTGQTQDGTLRDMPIANYMRDAMEAFAGRLGAVPELRVDPPMTGGRNDDSEAKQRAAEKRARIVAHYDDDDNDGIPERIPMLARWVPGASYAVWTIDPVMVNDFPYPRATLHHPLDTMLAQWTSITHPEDVGFITRIPVRELHRLYPEHAGHLPKREIAVGSGGAVLLDRQREGLGMDVVQYYDQHGTWWLVPARRLLLDFTPNPLRSGPAFVALTKYNYGRLRGEYDDMVGPMISMARLQIMAELMVRKDVFAPTNIYGNPPISGPYQTGFGKINEFDATTRVDIPQGTIQFQAWQQLDRFERQLRIEGTSPTQDSGESPMSFVTGRGLNALTERVERSVKEYQRIFKAGLQRLDAKRLEYDEAAWPDIAKPMQGVRSGAQFSETYTPRTHIKGAYRTRREYGAMASVDEAVRLNGLMMMDSASWVSKTWIRSQLDELGIPVSQLEEQLRNEQWDDMFRTVLAAHATTPESPEHLPALQMVVESMPAGPMKALAEKWLTARGDQPDPAEVALMEQMQGMGQPPPDVGTVLARLTATGQPSGGTQVVSRL